MTGVLAARRAEARARLDSAPNVVAGGEIGFGHAFEAVEDAETFCRAPEDVVDAARRLLALDAADGIAAAVHDTVVVQIGCNRVPIFAMVNGGRGRGLFSFRCVYPACSAFLDVRVLPHADVVKWVIIGVSHTHDFATFPPRMPRNTFGRATQTAIRQMVLQNHTSAEIRLAQGVLCNKDVLYGAVRSARAEMRSEQSRALRDAAATSRVWSSAIHLTEDSVFAEASPTSGCFVSDGNSSSRLTFRFL